MRKIYYIGGSPCSGKSTIAAKLAEKYNLYYFEADKFLDDYTARGAAKNYPICISQSKCSQDEIWMREPAQQCKDEIQYYEEVFEFTLQDLQKVDSDSDIITEGACYLPHLMRRQGISATEYFSVVPSPEFQISHYKQREWIHFILDECSEPETAFQNWMKRDILFAQYVSEECLKNGFENIVNAGQISPEDLLHKAEAHFKLIHLTHNCI